MLTARALLPQLRERYPRLRIFLSTTTHDRPAGGAHATSSDVDGVFYFPFDWPFIVRRTLRLVKPRLFVMMETEIWPNLLRACRSAGVKTVLVNGRISPRSFPRYRLVRPFFRRVLADVDRFCMQSEESARRIIEIGADRDARDGHRQPEVRLAGDARAGGGRSRRATACCAISGSSPRPAGGHRRAAR